MGSLLYALFQALSSSRNKLRLFSGFLSLFVGLGVFVNNVNLDLYFEGSQREKKFWREFTQRFPGLPAHAVFLMDVRDDIPFFVINNGYFYVDLNSHYDFEFPINMLYAKTDESNSFRRYKACSMRSSEAKSLLKNTDIDVYKRLSHWGEDIFDPREFIVVHYRGGELLVNREIIQKYPDVPYYAWADKDFPELPEPVLYPLRHKILR